ncbi:MAG: hypothetical protein K8U03_14835 [Planctomycetia bacterium]|nr:hypothetical protein [Planctomycetia bacterium]
MFRKLGLGSVVVAAILCNRLTAGADDLVFPALGSAQSVRGELVGADFIHRTGRFRTTDGELKHFSMPPYAIMSYRGTESDLRDVPLGTEMEFLLLPDEDGGLTRLVGTKHAGTFDAAQRKRFIEFTTARGIAGRVDRTAGKTLTVTFFSGDPELFATTWDRDFAQGKEVRVCVGNDELRTWQPTSCSERGTIVEVGSVPVEGYGCSGRRVVIQVNNMLEGFRRGRVVRVFGAGWKLQNQFFQECLINYGYMHRPTPDFRECLAKHYPDQFPYRTDYGNRQLPWFQAKEGSQPPMYSEHVMFGELSDVDAANGSGEFKAEPTGEAVKFTMLDTGSRSSAVRFQTDSFEESRSKLADLQLGVRYRFHMYQDAEGRFTRCGFICDDYSQATLNGFRYRIRNLDLERGRVEVQWQSLPVLNYQKDTETPPPYGQSVLRLVPETRVWKGKTAAASKMLKVGDMLKFNATGEFAGRPSHCVDVWIDDGSGGKAR